jgi:hypothetical protein
LKVVPHEFHAPDDEVMVLLSDQRSTNAIAPSPCRVLTHEVTQLRKPRLQLNGLGVPLLTPTESTITGFLLARLAHLALASAA